MGKGARVLKSHAVDVPSCLQPRNTSQPLTQAFTVTKYGQADKFEISNYWPCLHSLFMHSCFMLYYIIIASSPGSRVCVCVTCLKNAAVLAHVKIHPSTTRDQLIMRA